MYIHVIVYILNVAGGGGGGLDSTKSSGEAGGGDPDSVDLIRAG